MAHGHGALASYGDWPTYCEDDLRRSRESAVGLLKATEQIWFVRFKVAGAIRAILIGVL